MYAGTTLTNYSGRIYGAHQKIDRVARKHLAALLQNQDKRFPDSKLILNFEGRNGPDGIKQKSPAVDEPWHYFNPFDVEDTEIIEIIADHHKNLIEALKDNDLTRAAFQASWLAHALVDGLTPAHHYPYEQELINLRGGLGIESRNTLKGKLVMPGDTIGKQLLNNWKMWGTKGLMTTHGAFEHGVATIIRPMSFKKHQPTPGDIADIRATGTVELFKRKAVEIASLDMYGAFYTDGWNSKLAKQTRKNLMPSIISMVTLSWFEACEKAKIVKK